MHSGTDWRGQGEAEGGIKESGRRRVTGDRERFPSPLVDPQSNVLTYFSITPTYKYFDLLQYYAHI